MPALAQPLVIFDLDGTVVDTMPATFSAFQDALEPALGRRPTREEILGRMGPADQHIIADWVGEEHAEDAVDRLYAAYERRFAGLGPFPGMRELIADLRTAGRRTALFTGRGRRSTDAILDGMGIRELFEDTVTGDEVAASKPSPDGLVKVLAQAGLTPADAVYVGDSPLDAQAAEGAGVEVVGALWGTHAPEEFDAFPKIYTVASVAALRRLLLGEPG